MELKIFMASEINQTQEDKCHIFSHMQVPDLKLFLSPTVCARVRMCACIYVCVCVCVCK